MCMGRRGLEAWDRAPDPARQAVTAKPSLLATPASQDCPTLVPRSGPLEYVLTFSGHETGIHSGPSEGSCQVSGLSLASVMG